MTETTAQHVELTEADARRLEAQQRTPPALRPLTPLPPGYHVVEPVRLTTEQFVQLRGVPALPFSKDGSRHWYRDGANYFNDGLSLRFEPPPAHPLHKLAVQFEWRKPHLRLAVDSCWLVPLSLSCSFPT